MSESGSGSDYTLESESEADSNDSACSWYRCCGIGHPNQNLVDQSDVVYWGYEEDLRIPEDVYYESLHDEEVAERDSERWARASVDSDTDQCERIRDMAMNVNSYTPHDSVRLHHLFKMDTTDTRPVIIYDKQNELELEILTRGQLSQWSNDVREVISRDLGLNNRFIAVALSPGIQLPAVLLGILAADCAFYYLDMNVEFIEHLKVIQFLGIEYLIMDDDYEFEQPTITSCPCPRSGKIFITESLLGSLVVKRVSDFKEIKPEFDVLTHGFAYAIRTSGTTKTRKVVLVSHASVVPNIQDISQKWFLGGQDVVFGASPPTFDPHLIELFVALSSGGKIVYVPTKDKLNPAKLVEVFKRHAVTVLQCTPSLLRRFEKEELLSIFSDDSSLRILALGGEPFPQKSYLRSVINEIKEKNMMIFNLYGTTEMSVWASMTRIYLNPDSDPIHISTLLSHTEFGVLESSKGELELYLRSRARYCTVVQENTGSVCQNLPFQGDYTWFRTGDVVEVQEEGNKKFVIYKGRSDRRVKRNGKFIDLNELEVAVMSTGLVEMTTSFDYVGKIYLIVVFKTSATTSSEFLRELRDYVHYTGYPDHVLQMSTDLPLTPNGKVDIKKVRQAVVNQIEHGDKSRPSYYECYSLKYQEDDVKAMLRKKWNRHTRINPATAQNFFEAGGDSISAMHLIEEVFQDLGQFGTLLQQRATGQFLNILMRKSYEDVEKFILEDVCKPAKIGILPARALITENVENITSTDINGLKQTNADRVRDNNLLKFPVASKKSWKVNLFGCVDLKPTIFESTAGPLIAAVGNSGWVAVISLQKLKSLPDGQKASPAILWKRRFPDRIVCEVAVHPNMDYILVSCMDYHIYAVNALSGVVKWAKKLNCPVQSTPAFNLKGTSFVVPTIRNRPVKFSFEDATLKNENKDADLFKERSNSPASYRLGSNICELTLHVDAEKMKSLKKFTRGLVNYRHLHADRSQVSTEAVFLVVRPEEDFLLYIFGLNPSGALIAYNCNDQSNFNVFNPVWERSLCEANAGINAPIIHKAHLKHDFVVCSTRLGQLFVLEALKGEILNSISLNGECPSSPTVVNERDDYIIVASALKNGVICFVRIRFPADYPNEVITMEIVGSLGEVQAGIECFSGIASYGNMLVYGSRDDHVHMLELDTDG